MSGLPVLPLLSFEPDWAETWEQASARFDDLKRQVNDQAYDGLPSHVREQMWEEYVSVGASLGAIFETQFATTDEYRDWRLKFFPAGAEMDAGAGYRMPTGLPISEIRRRLEEAQRCLQGQVGNAVPLKLRLQIREIISADPSAEVATLADVLRNRGGDRVRDVCAELPQSAPSRLVELKMAPPGLGRAVILSSRAAHPVEAGGDGV
ncbi:MAG: hypothetical protein KGH75_01215 [Rhodospirillales bacterium]|nr:hypothetical protein [Rhodospirillales bacterium]